MTDLLTGDIDIYTVCANDRPVVGRDILQPSKPRKLWWCSSFIERIWCFGKSRGKMAKKSVIIHAPQTSEETIFDKTLSRQRNRSAMASGLDRYATLSTSK